MKKAIWVLFLLLLAGCSNEPVILQGVTIDDSGEGTQDDHSSLNQFKITLNENNLHEFYRSELNFTRRKVKIDIISAHTTITGSVQLRLYGSQDHLTYSTSFDVNGDIVQSTTVPLDFVPHYVELECNGYSGSMTLQVSGI